MGRDRFAKVVEEVLDSLPDDFRIRTWAANLRLECAGSEEVSFNLVVCQLAMDVAHISIA